MHNIMLSACSPGLNLERSLNLRPNMCTTLQILNKGVSKRDVSGISDHTYTTAIELSQSPAYASTGREGRADMAEEGIYEN